MSLTHCSAQTGKKSSNLPKTSRNPPVWQQELKAHESTPVRESWPDASSKTDFIMPKTGTGSSKEIEPSIQLYVLHRSAFCIILPVSWVVVRSCLLFLLSVVNFRQTLHQHKAPAWAAWGIWMDLINLNPLSLRTQHGHGWPRAVEFWSYL